MFYSKVKNSKIKLIVLIAIIITLGTLELRGIFSPGPLTRSDNPVHLVEAEYLKNVLIPEYNWINGWYPYVYAGIPIQLYSHQLGIWLIAFLSYILSISTVFSYKLVVLAAFIIPPIALMLILKKRFGLIAAFIPAAFFLFQIEYNNMMAAGMWNSGIGLIFLIIQMHLIDKYKKNITTKRIAIISMLQAVTILSHLYVAISSFLLSAAAALLYTYKYKNKKNLMWLLPIPISILLTAFYTFYFIETNSWLNTEFGWGLGETIIETIYKLIGIFFSLKQNTYFLSPLISHNYLEALYIFAKGIIINLPTIIIDILGILGLISYIKLRKSQKIKNLEFIELILVFTVFMLIIGSGFWFLTNIGNNIPFFRGILAFKFVYYARIALYILAAFYLSNIINNYIQTKKFIKNIIKCSIFICLLLLFAFNNIYMVGEGNTQTFSNAPIKNETEELWSWLDTNLENDAVIADPITFANQVASQSTLLALTPMHTNVTMLSTWVISYYPIEKYMSSDNWKLFNIPRKEITPGEIKDNMEYFNAKYILTIESDMKSKLKNDKNFELLKNFKTYSIYRLKNFTPSLIQEKIEYKVLKKKEQEIILEINNKNVDKEITIKIGYHPYWNGYLDNKKITVERNEKELIKVKIPNGNHTLKLEYNPIKPVNIAISIITLIVLFYLIIKKQ